MTLKSKKVLVTGAGGFIGSHLCEHLIEKGAEVTALVRYNARGSWGNLELLSREHRKALTVISGNVEDSDSVSNVARGKEVLFHLAALIGIPYSYLAPRSYLRTNVEGTLNVMEAARIHNVEKVIHTSTSETYGTAIYTPVDEKHPLRGQSPYSASKIAGDKLVESYHCSFNLPVATVRPFNTYGPRQSARAVIPTIISQALTQSEIRLGTLSPVRDLSFVKDIVEGFSQVAESEMTVGETLNIGSGTSLSIGELAEEVLRILNSQKRIVQDEERTRPPASEVFWLICDNRKAIQMTGWAPKHTLQQGLAETIDFVSSHLDLFKADQYAL